LKEIGKFHALTYGLVKWEGEKIFGGPLRPHVEVNSIETLEREARILTVCKTRSARLQNSLELIRTRNPQLHHRMSTFCAETNRMAADPQTQFALSYGTDTDHFPVIIHGDLWTNNI